MKKSIILSLFIVGFIFNSSAQQINPIPTKEIRQLPNGWHKFISEGATFDVEILNSSLTTGNIIWFDTSTYSGKFYDNQIAGRGTYTWPNGDRYEGSFKGSMLHGKGTYYKKDGTKHQGKWKNNKKNGKGKVYNSDGTILKEGVWEEGQFIEK